MIQLTNIKKSFEVNKQEKVEALKGITLHIKEGELVVLKGSSGSGKSSILSLIAGLSKPTSGDVIVDGKKISKLPDDFAALYRRKSVGMVFQKHNLISTLSVKENILLPLIPMNLDEMEVEQKIQNVMKMFHIEHKKNIVVKNLSGGEQQRVAIARANVTMPKIILADEPTASLDKKLSQDFIKILQEMKKQGKTIVIATHDPLFFGLDIVDKELEIAHGEII